MGNTFKLGNYVNGIFQDASNNIGIGAAPSGTYKFEVTGTAKVSSTLLVSGAATFSSTVNVNGATATTNLNVLGVAGTMVGTTATNQQLRITAPTTTANAGAGIRFDASSGAKEATANIGVVNNATGNTGSLVFNVYNGGADFPEQMRITSAGNVGIGTSSPSDKLQVSGVIRASNTTDPSYYGTFSNPDGLTHIGTFGGGSMVFDVSGTERMRITSGGDINMNATSGNKLVTVKGQTGNGYYGEVRMGNVDHSAGIIGKHVSSGNANLEFWTEYYSSGGYQKRMTIDYAGNIGAPTGTNIYNASDIRLKQNITTIENGLDKVLGLNPVMFNWVNGFVESEDGKDMLGFIAQEVQDIIPEAVEGFNSGNTINLDDVQIDNPLRVNEKFIIPILVKAIQEMNTKLDEQNQTIQNLQAQNQDLKSRLDKAGL